DGSAPPQVPPEETPTGGTASAVPTPIATPTPPPPAPNTLILRRPPRLVLTPLARARVVFRFGSDQAGVTFLCRVDRAPFGRCRERIVRRLAPGRHVLKVKARNAGGLVDATSAVFRFRVERT
ncbi:MAG TPA: hypothetical protein VK480_10015, partial [Solirubrobacterales bacterium]|nr:hypothetical protein [Solirubrobacterales bacterium]